jgi:hypothetical protein
VIGIAWGGVWMEKFGWTIRHLFKSHLHMQSTLTESLPQSYSQLVICR